MANNLRVVYDNAADRATLSASSEAGNLVVSNLLTNYKAEVWRSTGTSATVTLTWDASEFVGMIALPFCNLTSAATFRVRGYTHATDSTPAFDTGAAVAAAGTSLEDLGWGSQPLGANAYAFSARAYGVAWFAIVPVEKIILDITDTSNPLGYLEASRIVAGAYWTPDNNADYGADLGLADTSKQERSDAGDLHTDRGMMHKTLSFNLGLMTAQDRNSFWNIIKRNGLYSPIFISLSPESDDTMEEEMFQIYGKLTKLSTIKYQFINQFSSQIEIEEV